MLVTSLDVWRTCAATLVIDGEEVVRVEDDGAALASADARGADGPQMVVLTGGDRRGDVVETSTVEEVRYARRGPHGAHTELLPAPETAVQLDLLPHPEGGWYRATWRTATEFTPDGYPGPRAVATGILFLLPPGEQSMWHVVRSDEVWLWHRGGPLDLSLGGRGERPGATTTVRLGPDIAAGEQVQFVVPGGTWQAARPAGASEVLVSCVVAPGFDFADFRV